jgi:hypothetical protein
VAQALREFPQYRTLTAANAKAGKSIYHAMQLRLAKRFSSGLADAVLQDNFNRGPERAVLS